MLINVTSAFVALTNQSIFVTIFYMIQNTQGEADLNEI